MLPQFGFSEFLLIAIVALVVVGPKDLPMMMRRLGQFVGKAKSMARDFQSAFEDIAKQTELDELRKEIEQLKKDNAVTDAQKALQDVEDDINAAIMRDTRDMSFDDEAPPKAPKPTSNKADAEPDAA